jgi:hypothetical protein
MESNKRQLAALERQMIFVSFLPGRYSGTSGYPGCPGRPGSPAGLCFGTKAIHLHVLIK